MLTVKAQVVQRRLGGVLTAFRTSTCIASCRRPLALPSYVQTRKVAAVPGKPNPDNMGGPGGQEHYPESNPLRRRYAMTTLFGVLAASSVLVAAKVAKLNKDPNASYVLVHDASKGELDDVKYIKTSDLPKS